MSKRLFDLVIVLGLAPVWVPVGCGVAFVVWAALGRPILFHQERPGLKGKTFGLIKFRTMSDQRDARGNLRPDEQRLSRFGKILRASSLDELPELVNILKGEMGLVGPRPLLQQYLPLYSPRQARRHEVKPGLTGWAQVNGRNALSWEEKLEMDVWYIEHRTLWLDFKILVRTAAMVVRGRGINTPGHATTPFFTGSAQGRRAA